MSSLLIAFFQMEIEGGETTGWKGLLRRPRSHEKEDIGYELNALIKQTGLAGSSCPTEVHVLLGLLTFR